MKWNWIRQYTISTSSLDCLGFNTNVWQMVWKYGQRKIDRGSFPWYSKGIVLINHSILLKKVEFYGVTDKGTDVV